MDFVLNNQKLDILNKEISSYHVDEEKLKYFSNMISKLNDLHSKSVSIILEADNVQKPKFLEDSINKFNEKLKKMSKNQKVIYAILKGY